MTAEMHTFLTNWAIHFAEACVALLIVLLITRVLFRYRAYNKAAAPADEKAVLASTSNPPSSKKTAPPVKKKEALNHYIDAFFDEPSIERKPSIQDQGSSKHLAPEHFRSLLES